MYIHDSCYKWLEIHLYGLEWNCMVWSENCMVWSEIVWFQIMNLMVWAGSGVGQSETTILGQHPPFMSIKSFVQHSGWQEMMSLCSLIRLIGVCADRDQPEFLCSRSDSRCLGVHVATAGGWLTRYRPREVRNSIYRYRKIHIDYRSKFFYRFISSISIIYGNTNIDTY